MVLKHFCGAGNSGIYGLLFIVATFMNDNTGLHQDDNGNDRDGTRGDVVKVVKHGDSGQGKI